MATFYCLCYQINIINIINTISIRSSYKARHYKLYRQIYPVFNKVLRKGVWWSGGLDPRLNTLSIHSKPLVSLTLYPSVKAPGAHCTGVWTGSDLAGTLRKTQNLPFPLGNEPWFAGHITPWRSLEICWRGRDHLAVEVEKHWVLKSDFKFKQPSILFSLIQLEFLHQVQ